VARSTRQQRRQRRAQQQPALAGGPPPARPPRPVSQGGGDEPSRRPERREERRDEVRPGVPGLRFIQESVAELKKVEWPSQQQVISGTAVVIIACLIVGVYLYGNDQLWSYVVKHVLLR
jgi:preprotein translocase subunit SecE